jgi:hypothetical protein
VRPEIGMKVHRGDAMKGGQTVRTRRWPPRRVAAGSLLGRREADSGSSPLGLKALALRPGIKEQESTKGEGSQR